MEEFGAQSSSNFHQQTIYPQPPKLKLQKPSSSKNEDASKNKPNRPTTISAAISQLKTKDVDIVDKLLQNTEAELNSLKTDVNEYFNILQTETQSIKSTCINKKCPKREEKSTPEVDEFFRILRLSESKKDEPSTSRNSKDILTPRSKTSTPRSSGSSRSDSRTSGLPPKRRESLKSVPTSQRKSFEVPSKKLSSEKPSQKKIIKQNKQFCSILQNITEEDKSTSTSRDSSPKKRSNCDHLCKRYEEHKMSQTDFEPLINSTFEYSQIPPNTPTSSTDKPETTESSVKLKTPEIIPEKPNIESSNESCEVVDVIDSFSSGKKKLSIQTLPAVDIRRPLVTQKMPDVVIQPVYFASEQENTLKYDNVKYLEVTHEEDVNKPVEIPKTIVKKDEILADKPEKITPIRHEVINDIIPEEDETLDDNNQKDVSIREELNLNIDDVPSVRTLKEIQNYLEQRCSLIRKRLDDERDLNPGEIISLRWKLNQPPRWKAASTETEDKTDSPIPKAESPKLSLPVNIQSKTMPKIVSPVKITDKATQYSLDSISSKLEQTEINKNVDSFKRQTNNVATLPPRIVQLNTVTKQLSIPDVTESTPEAEIAISNLQQEVKVVKDSATQFSPENKVKKSLSRVTNSEMEIQTVNSVPAVKDSATQSSPEKYKKPLINKSETQIVSLQPTIKEVKESSTQYSAERNGEKLKLMDKTSNLVFLEPVVKELKESATQMSPKKVEKKESYKAVTFTESATQKDASPKKLMKTVASGVTENELKPTESDDKCISCNLGEFSVPDDRQQKILESSVDPCCALFNPARKINIDRYRTSRNRSPERTEARTTLKCDSSSESSSIKINKFKCKRLQQKYRKSSTPISSSSTYTTTENNSDDISLSEGEVRLPCECSTSIGEIHLCHFANNIRKKVRTLKQNPDKVVRESFDTTDFNVAYKYKYYDNWVTYYVTKSNRTVSSGEVGTHSNLSSITSITPSD